MCRVGMLDAHSTCTVPWIATPFKTRQGARQLLMPPPSVQRTTLSHALCLRPPAKRQPNAIMCHMQPCGCLECVHTRPPRHPCVPISTPTLRLLYPKPPLIAHAPPSARPFLLPPPFYPSTPSARPFLLPPPFYPSTPATAVPRHHPPRPLPPHRRPLVTACLPEPRPAQPQHLRAQRHAAAGRGRRHHCVQRQVGVGQVLPPNQPAVAHLGRTRTFGTTARPGLVLG